jgi:hypothetical protein
MTSQQTTVREVQRDNDWAPDEAGERVGLLLPAHGNRWVPARVRP